MWLKRIYDLPFTHTGGAPVTFATRKDIAMSSQFLVKFNTWLSGIFVHWKKDIYMCTHNSEYGSMKTSKQQWSKANEKPVLGYIFFDWCWHFICIQSEVLFVEESCLREYHTVCTRPPNRPPSTINVVIHMTILHREHRLIRQLTTYYIKSFQQYGNKWLSWVNTNGLSCEGCLAYTSRKQYIFLNE